MNNIPYSAKYSESAIMEAYEAGLKPKGYMKVLRSICEREGYKLVTFRRWLHRNGINSSHSAAQKKIKAKKSGYMQFTFNVPAEYVALLDMYKDKSSTSRTKLMQQAIVEYVANLKKGKSKIPAAR
jgi:hypothetical protein